MFTKPCLRNRYNGTKKYVDENNKDKNFIAPVKTFPWGMHPIRYY
jgi:hypothetical protein